MNQTVTVSLSDGLYQALKHRAESTGATPAQVVEKLLAEQFKTVDAGGETEREQSARRFERHFGAVSGVVGNLDNESIDADLAREYADNHEED